GPAPDFLDPELVEFKVPIRPEYQHDRRRYPCPESITLRICGVTGRQDSGLLVCSLPLLGQRFFFTAPSTLRSLAVHYVQQYFEGMTPQHLARYLPPAAVQLEQVVVRVNATAVKPSFGEESRALQAVAEALGDPRVRRPYARPWERDQEVAHF